MKRTALIRKPRTCHRCGVTLFGIGRGRFCIACTSNKYGVAAPEDRTYDGRTYRSKLETIKAKELDLLLRAGEIVSWEYEPKFELKVNGVKIGNHYPDFLVVDKNGREVIIEAKGARTEAWKKNWRLMKALYPAYDYELFTWEDVR